MLTDALANWNVILASGSPRRHQFFKELAIPFEVQLKPVDEVYPKQLKAAEIANYLSVLKAKPFEGNIKSNEIVVTSDTVVWYNGISLAKAADTTEAYEMLKMLSGSWHEVITSVTFTTKNSQKTKHHSTKVKFKTLSDDEIWYYINKAQPFDKAGAYGIQEWIGLIAIEEIQGSYTNVVGLPTHLVYDTLLNMVG